MSLISDSGKSDYYGNEAHPYIKRVVDNLPAGRLLLAGETAGHHAAYAAEAGWKVHAIGFKPEDEQKTLALAKEKEVSVDFDLYQPGAVLCQGKEFDAAILLFVHLPAQARRAFHQDVIKCLQPQGGNLYLLAYSEEQPAGSMAKIPQIRYCEADLVDDFRQLQIDLLQEEEEQLPDSDQKIRLIHLTAVKNQQAESKDSVSFKL